MVVVSAGATHSVGIEVVGGEVVGGGVITVVGTVVVGAVEVVVDAVESPEPPRVITKRAAPMITMRAMSTLASCLNGTSRW